MPELCDCGDPCCSSCFPWSHRQTRAWERDQAVRDRERETEGDNVTLPYTIDRGFPWSLNAWVWRVGVKLCEALEGAERKR